MPMVSVIIPVYNVEKYLRDCLNSITAQYYKDIEVICIDDGSIDNSYTILKEFVERDKRVITIKQDNKGAAYSRNLGIKLAKGKYVIFLDADDYFDKSMLAKAVSKAESRNADLVIFKAVSFDDKTKKKSILNDRIGKYHKFQYINFSVKDIPNDILNSFLVAPWNKLYRKKFLDQHGFQFQNVKRTNDLLFTSATLLAAKNITLIDEVFVYYRTGQEKSLQACNDKSPLEFYKALLALKNFLQHNSLFNIVYISYIKLIFDVIFYNLDSIKSVQNKNLMIKFFQNQGFSELGLMESNKLYRISCLGYLQYKITMSNLLIPKDKLLSLFYFIYKIEQYYNVAGLKGVWDKVNQKIAIRSRR